MKIITILGSPKKKGKTAEVLGLFEKIILSKEHEIERIDVTDYHINGCIGCYACMSKTNEPGCVQNDDMALILEKMLEADAIVYATPLYSFNFTAQMKPLVDRHMCLIKKPLLKGKRTALLVTCAAQEEGNADLIKEAFRRSFDGNHGGMVNTDLIGEYVVERSGAPDFTQRSEVIACRLASDLLGEIV
jgi:multimeric flavodoxin WrbA